MPVYKTQGIILKRKNFREDDRIFTVFTKDFGKLDLMARGTRKIKSKLAGSLEPFFLVNLMFAKGRNFDQITASEIIQSFINIRQSSYSLKVAGYLAEMVNQFTKLGHRDEKIFYFLKKNLEYLNKKTFKPSHYFIQALSSQFISLLGFRPELYICTNCHKKITLEKNYFSYKKGGITCPQCQDNMKEAVPIGNSAIKLMRLFLEKDLDQVSKIKYNKNLHQETKNIINDFLRYHLER